MTVAATTATAVNTLGYSMIAPLLLFWPAVAVGSGGAVAEGLAEGLAEASVVTEAEEEVDGEVDASEVDPTPVVVTVTLSLVVVDSAEVDVSPGGEMGLGLGLPVVGSVLISPVDVKKRETTPEVSGRTAL